MEKLDDCLAQLNDLQRFSLDEYKANRLVQGSAERYFQVAIECCADIASHLIAAYGLKRPVDRKDVFKVLGEAGYLEKDYAATMVQMAQLRNRLVHLYWDIDPEKMYGYLQNDLVFLERFKAFALAAVEAEEKAQADRDVEPAGQEPAVDS